MLRTNYASLFSLRIQHDYFPGDICPVVELIPIPTTATRMRQFGVRSVRRGAGIELFYETSRPPHSTEAIPFTFLLRPTDYLFHNYTDGLPDDTAFLPFGPETELPPYVQAGDLGQYTVSLLPGTGKGNEFLLSFTARATFWRYHVISRNATDNEQYDLLDGQTKEVVATTGDNPVKQALPNGDEAIVLTTKSPISLRQEPQPPFALRIQAASTNQELPLPAATPDRLQKDPKEGSRFYSDLFVYL